MQRERKKVLHFFPFGIVTSFHVNNNNTNFFPVDVGGEARISGLFYTKKLSFSHAAFAENKVLFCCSDIK